MIRGFFVVVGTFCIGFSIWLIAEQNVHNRACDAAHPTLGQLTGQGMSSECLNIVWYYFCGFALLAFGLIAMITAISMMRKQRRGHRTREIPKPGPFDGHPS
ncbi:MAG: hypothetical protein ABSC34_04085 [Acidimicrobiales bacterium]|jgi:hypothetical protein